MWAIVKEILKGTFIVLNAYSEEENSKVIENPKKAKWTESKQNESNNKIVNRNQYNREIEK